MNIYAVSSWPTWWYSRLKYTRLSSCWLCLIAMTRHKKILCVPTFWISSIWQSKLTKASSKIGAPVLRVVHSPILNRSSELNLLDANAFEMYSCCVLSTFTASTLFLIKCACEREDWFIHTSNVGGVSVTLQTADAVKPCVHAIPSVVITFTAVVNKDIAFLKSVASIISFVSNVYVTCLYSKSGK